jgi:hypothetical protein
MKGRGIIYISSDKGPDAYRNPGNLVTEAWSKPKLLQYAILHEVGHVMGIPHIGIGLMSETFLTNALNVNSWTFFADQPYMSFTQPLGLAQVCQPSENDTFEPSFFGLDSTQKCMKLEKRPGQDFEWAVSSSTGAADPFHDVGSLKATSTASTVMSQKPVIFVYLPDTQKVFQKTDLGFADFLIGAVTSAQMYQGIFTTTGSHKPNHVQINVDAESIVVSGVVNNQIVPVFNHALAALKGIIIP